MVINKLKYLDFDIQMFADGEITYKVTVDGKEAERTISNLSKSSDNLSKKFTSFGKKMTIGVTTPLAGFSTYAVKMASDLSEVQNVVDTTFKESSNTINEFAKNAAEKFGLSELSAKQFTGTMGAMLKSMGLGNQEVTDMSMALAGLAGDMASFYNLDPTEAFEKLRSGISGETEPLKQLGINMSVVNLEAFALSKGITKSYDSMTQAEQATLRYQYIMETTADAQGDYSKTADSTANKTRTTMLQFQTLSAELGQQLLPIVNDVLGVLQNVIKWFNNLDDSGKRVVLILGGIALAIGPLATAIGGLITIGTGISKITEAMKKWEVVTKLQAVATKAMTIAQGALNTVMNMNPISLIVIAIVALIAIIIVLWNKCEWFREGVMTVINAIWGAIQSVASFIMNIFKTVFNVVSSIFNAIWSVVQTVFNFIRNIVQSWVNFWVSVWNTVFNVVSSVITTIWNVIKSVFDFIWGIISGVINSIISAFRNVANIVKSVFTSVKNAISSLFKGVVNIIKAPINGLIGLINGVIKGLNKIKLPDWVPAIGGKGINIPLIPKLATGTNYVAGEGLAYLHEGEAVVPKKYNPAIGGYGNYNQPIYVTVNADMDVNKFGKAFVRDIKTFSGGSKNSYNYGGSK